MGGHCRSAKRWLLIGLAAAVLLGPPPGAWAEAPQLESREYKLILNPAKFAGPPQPIVDRLWKDVLQRVIAQRLDRTDDGEFRHKKSFSLKHERFVVFRDALAVIGDKKTCLLDASGHSFRDRTRVKDGRRELTLKFRTPDIFLAAQSTIGTESDEIKFEEDIAPLIVRTVTASNQDSAAYARPPTMRSLFSRSATRRIKSEPSLKSLADLAGMQPGLKAALRRAGVKDEALQAPLLTGERFHELVFSGALVDLGKKVNAEFDLTLWHIEGTAQPAIAELSFKYEVEDGEVDGGVAWRALVLFRALQETLGDWASPESETKTSLALPKSCHQLELP
jgi:hypothetical protein